MSGTGILILDAPDRRLRIYDAESNLAAEWILHVPEIEPEEPVELEAEDGTLHAIENAVPYPVRFDPSPGDGRPVRFRFAEAAVGLLIGLSL